MMVVKSSCSLVKQSTTVLFDKAVMLSMICYFQGSELREAGLTNSPVLSRPWIQNNSLGVHACCIDYAITLQKYERCLIA